MALLVMQRGTDFVLGPKEAPKAPTEMKSGLETSCPMNGRSWRRGGPSGCADGGAGDVPRRVWEEEEAGAPAREPGAWLLRAGIKD